MAVTSTDTRNFDIKDPSLAADGRRRIEWAAREMPVLAQIKERFAREKPLTGLRLLACAHITTETANLALTCRRRGGRGARASNPHSRTQDDVAAARWSRPASRSSRSRARTPRPTTATSARRSRTSPTSSSTTAPTWLRPFIATIPSSCRRSSAARGDHHRRHPRARDGEGGRSQVPIVAVNDADTKHFFDNATAPARARRRHPAGDQPVDRGKTVVVAGYGWCGKGIAMRMQGHGGQVIVTEVDSTRALEAADGRLPGDAIGEGGTRWLT